MNALAWLTDMGAVLVPVLGFALLDFLWQGLLIATIYGLLRGLVLRGATPAVHALLGQLAMLAFVLAPALTVAARWPVGGEAATAGSLFTQAISDGLATVQASTDAGIEGWMPVIVGLWSAGVAFLGLRTALQWLRLRRICAGAAPLGPQWQQTLARLQARLGVEGEVLLRETGTLLSPALFGWVRPVILLPAGLVTRLPREQVELLLLHELAHARRWDYLANLMQVAVETLLFYHPAVHWVSRRLRADRELACDDLVTRSGGNRLAYASALAEIESRRCAVLRGPGVAMAAQGGQLLHRIERIVGLERPSEGRSSLGTGLAAVAAAGAILLAMQWMPSRPFELSLRSLPLPGLAASFDVAPLQIPTIALPERRIAQPAITAPHVDLAEPATSEPAGTEGRPAAFAFPADSAVVDAPLEAVIDEPVAPIGPAQVRQAQITAGLPEASASDTALATTTAPAATREGSLAPLATRAPAYPRAARLQGVEGSVVLEFSLDAGGQPVGVSILSAQPRGVFERAARDAIAAWRFPAGAVGPEHRLTQTFDFRLGARDSDAEACEQRTGSRLCWPTR